MSTKELAKQPKVNQERESILLPVLLAVFSMLFFMLLLALVLLYAIPGKVNNLN
ncbi:hypothetical protein [Mycoplasmoides pneumoniae]|uniref:Uncharacterized protein n=2 Tax=Mycoplasmoides pneumoniae TaxID=2104 RepID=A0AB38W8P1_MYCPM|nr:hypothetical protein [Mycoplasmoides pneumoniae]ADK87225.1 hypothetical protein MPNE_0090 [Mycoplasmoides pneumoniae FH]VEU57429.1 Uncharacterised protein [Mycoplasmoides pneumoniae]